MPELFLKLLNMSISAGWIVLAVLILRLLMKKAPKWMTCALWALVAIRLILPFSIESVFSLIPSTQTLPNEIITGNRFEISSGVPVIDQQVNGEILGSYFEGVTVPVDNGLNILSAASIVWLVGMVLMFLYCAVSYLRLHREVCVSICLRENIYLCDYIDTPFILGGFRPRIYLPSSLDQANWPHVIAHEQAHLKRRDHWWKPLGFGLLCLHWFNPLLWLAYILLCRDIELACDEKVIRDLGGQEKQAYSEALLECSMPRYLIAACPLAFGEVGVKERVKSILNYKKPAFWVVLIAMVLCVTAAICFLTDPLGSHSVIPGVYTYDLDIYKTPYADSNTTPTVPAGVYTLDENKTLYRHYGGKISALGTMEHYALDSRELSGYLKNDDAWLAGAGGITNISDALWLRMEDQSFYLFFRTADGSTYLARGWEDYGERNTNSDDTRITHLCQMILRDQEIEKDMTYLVGTVTEVKQTSFQVQADGDPTSLYQVSLWWHAYDAATNIAADGIMPAPEAGARVLVTFDGDILRRGEEYRISTVYDIRVLKDSGVDCIALSENHGDINPLLLPKDTDVASVEQLIPMLGLYPGNGYQFTLLYDDIQISSGFRLYDFHTREEIPGFSSPTEGTHWDLLEPDRKYIVTAEHNHLILFAVSVSHDFGITMTARNVSPTGVTIDCVQSGGSCPGPFMYGEYYRLEKFTGEKWVELQNLDGTYGGTFFTIAYALHQNDSTSWRFNWQDRYGELEPGLYRFVRSFSHSDRTIEYSYIPYYAEFTIS